MYFPHVAPHVGAWIEIDQYSASIWAVNVAPHVGAWIEIYLPLLLRYICFVAPHVGAWIEIEVKLGYTLTEVGRTPRGCVD